MASKRDLKKDINYLVDEVIGTCMMRQTLNDQKTQEEMDKLIREMLDFREDMLNRVNNPNIEEKTGKAIRNHYRSLYGELLTRVNGVFDRLDAITE